MEIGGGYDDVLSKEQWKEKTAVFILRVWARGGEVVQNFARKIVLLSKCLCFENLSYKSQGERFVSKNPGGGGGETLLQSRAQLCVCCY